MRFCVMKSKNIGILLCITALIEFNGVCAGEETRDQEARKLLSEVDEYLRIRNRSTSQYRPATPVHRDAPQPPQALQHTQKPPQQPDILIPPRSQTLRPLFDRPLQQAPAQQSSMMLMNSHHPASSSSHDEKLARIRQIEADAQLARCLQEGALLQKQSQQAPARAIIPIPSPAPKSAPAVAQRGVCLPHTPCPSQGSSESAVQNKQIQEDEKLARMLALEYPSLAIKKTYPDIVPSSNKQFKFSENGDRLIPFSHPHKANEDYVTLLPCLQQTVAGNDGSEQTTANCGYYALWNALCTHSQAPQAKTLCRTQFQKWFNEMQPHIYTNRLNTGEIDSKSSDAEKFEYLHVEEIQALGKLCGETIYIIDNNKGELQRCGENWADTEQRLEEFCILETDKLVCIIRSGAHYLTVLVEKNNEALSFQVQDSLPGCDIDQGVLHDKIYFLYCFLKNKIVINKDQ